MMKILGGFLESTNSMFDEQTQFLSFFFWKVYFEVSECSSTGFNGQSVISLCNA